MPHGRPEEGVKKTGFALVTLRKPLAFNHEDNDPVDILITMAAVDANTHQEVGIMQIVNLFDDEANFLDITSQKREKNKNDEFSGEIKSIQVANRETARVIKNFYDNSNNIIEANRFYALEMEEREKELAPLFNEYFSC